MPPPEVTAEAEKVFAAESAIAGVRVAIVGLNTFVYLALFQPVGSIGWLADLTMVTANLYAIGVWGLRPYRRFPVLLSSYFTTLLDAVFITIWLLATGGFESPFYLLWMISVTAVAFRYDVRATMFAAVVYAASYLGLVAALGQAAANVGPMTVRIGYIFLTAALGGLLSREVFRQTQAKVELQALTADLRESEDRFRRLSDATFEGIAIHDKGRIVEVNEAFARMWGYTPEELVGRQAEELIDPSSVPAVRARIATPQDDAYEVLALRKDGTVFDAEVSSRHMPWRGHPARVVAAHDITARKRAERVTREREVLAVQNERLREMDAVKSRFINTAAHELGTPLTPIKLQAHLLRLGNLGELTDRQRHALDVLSRNVDHLGIMVKDLLDASRVQTQQLQMNPVEMDLSELLGEVAQSYDGSGGVRVRTSGVDGLTVRADPLRVKQVLLNLVGNALKFTPQGGSIELRARTDETEVHVEVVDTGHGIEADMLPRLFQPFSQIHDTTNESRAGAGLGLYISKGIVTAHGGHIWATSPGRGRGATFHVRLPVAGPEVAARIES